MARSKQYSFGHLQKRFDIDPVGFEAIWFGLHMCDPMRSEREEGAIALLVFCFFFKLKERKKEHSSRVGSLTDLAGVTHV